MECTKIQTKLKLLFEKLAEPDYAMDSYYADGLINKLSNSSDPEISFLEKAPLLSDLIADALDHTENAHNSVKVFLTRILAISAKNELHFAKILFKQTDKILAGFRQVNSPNLNPSLRVAYLEVALAVVKHDSGISWLLETGLWKEILSLCYQKTTVFVIRQTYKFITEFVWRLNDMSDAENIRVVSGHLIEPVNRIEFLNFQSLSPEEEEEFTHNIEPMLQILLCIVSKENRINQSSILMNVLVKELKITSYLYMTCDRLRRDDVSLLVVKVICWFGMAKVFLSKPMLPGAVYKAEDFLEVAAANFNTIQSFIQRRSATLVLDFCASCIIIFHAICHDQDVEGSISDSEKPVNLKNQMLLMCLIPVLTFVKSADMTANVPNECLDNFLSTLFDSSCEYTTKAGYALRDLTLELGILPITLQSVKKLMCLKEYLNDEQANLAFQALFYVLQQYSPVNDYGDEANNVTYDECQEKNLVMTYVIDTVLSLVKNRNIHWHESLEITCLFNVVFYILQRPDLSCKFVVIALNVIGQTIKKFLQPNLWLLLESKPGSAIHDLGKLIYMKMHDRNWEIRDTALELLHICTEISYIKFPPFQKQIIDNNLINVAATIAFNDYESYVQVSALKCVGAASKISAIWDKLTVEFPDIQDRLLNILRNNEEGIVRREACNVLCDIYQNLKLTPTFTQTLYEHMASSAICDFHWEVQHAALKFWRNVYRSLLTDQGMLDGKFPPVTFSKESRKIVTLNEAEIQRRLIKILDELSSIGCLTVFVKLMYDDTEIETMNATLSTSLELLDILDKYKVPDCLKHKDGDPASVEELMCHIKEDNHSGDDAGDMNELINPENVIEDILNADDINLLSNIYERHMTLQSKKVEAPLKPKIKLLGFASPHLFVTFFKKTNYKQVIEEKRQWNVGIRNVSSLLDDILGLYEVNDEVNSLDCY